MFQNFSLFSAGVVDTADKHSFANISANFKKFETILIGYTHGTGAYNNSEEER
jgi:hypothetical protein